jgi:hypothetical protein
MRRPLAERAPHQRQGERLGFERLDNPEAQTVPQQRDERLRPRIDPETGAVESHRSFRAKIGFRRQLFEHLLADRQRKARVAAGNGVADVIAFLCIEEDDLVRFRNRLASPHMVDIDAAIGKHHMRGSDGFLCAPVPASPMAHDIPDGRGVGDQQGLGCEFGHGFPCAFTADTGVRTCGARRDQPTFQM